MKFKWFFLGLLSFQFLISNYCFSQSAYFDKNFGDNGVLLLEESNASYWPYSLDISNDNKYYVCGSLQIDNDHNPIVQKFLENGRFDITFGTGGTQILNQVTENGRIIDAVIQDDEKLLLAINARINSQSKILVYRILPNGELDLSFNIGGYFVLESPFNALTASKIIVQRDQKILVLGKAEFGSKAILYRINVNGTTDDEFGVSGFFSYDFEESGLLESIIETEDEKFVAVGQAYNGDNNDVFVIKIDKNGSLDTSFGNEGTVMFDLEMANDFGKDIILNEDLGGFIIAGTTNQSSEKSGVLLGITDVGSINTHFGTNGFEYLDDPDNFIGVSEIKKLEDDKFLVGGIRFSDLSFKNSWFFRSYDNNGKLYREFGENGEIIVDLDGEHQYGSMKVDNQNNILVTGFYIEEPDEVIDDFKLLIVKLDSKLITNVVDFSNSSYNLNFYPNPVINNITVNLGFLPKGEYTVSIYNTLGERMSLSYVDIFNKQQELIIKDVAHYEKGNYILTLRDKNGYIMGNLKFVL